MLPARVINKMVGMCRKFLWSGNGLGSMYLVAWNDITRPYEE